jgi:hypothetical protein
MLISKKYWKTILFYQKKDPYFFLSNFYKYPFMFNNEKWLLSEGYFQAMKFRSPYPCMSGAFAYIINKKSANFFLNYIIPIYKPLDVLFEVYNINLNMYSYNIIDVIYYNCELSTCNTNYKL